EQVLVDFMSLGQRFNWGQLVAFVSRIDDPETLRLQAALVRKSEKHLPVLFAAVELSGKPEATAKYLMSFSQTGWQDLGASLRYGVGGLNELLRRAQRLYQSATRWHVALGSCLRTPQFALSMKWVLYLLGGFL